MGVRERKESRMPLISSLRDWELAEPSMDVDRGASLGGKMMVF